ncbi:hypothetical protein M1271_05800 [Patescibacteria group bacterium]|nr:hypothetical protein [Patescibacteria group bacterium]MCL5797748.1 hypothetical protein [Patescibacteria group bacterium]
MGINNDHKAVRLEACIKIRNIAAHTCLLTLQQIVNKKEKISEMNFRNRWNKELEKEWKSGFIDCWYDPPPGGIASIFCKEEDYNRLNYPTLRDKKYWPRPDVFFQNEGFGYIFVSPYTMFQNLPIIGDFGMTYYLGEMVKMRDHYRKSYVVYTELIDSIKAGMTFQELCVFSEKTLKNHNLVSFVVGKTDKTGFDFGHTVPFIDRDPDKAETSKVNSGNPDQINKAISEARIFINRQEKYEISDNCAFTFEPRITSLDHNLPIFSFHTIILFEKGIKKVLSNFDGIINLLGMEWLRE